MKRTDSIRRDLPQLQTQRRNSSGVGRSGGFVMQPLVPYPGGATHKLENNYIAQVLPKHWELWAPWWAPQHQKNKPPDHLALKASRTSFQESQKPMGNRDSTPKGDTHNLTHSRTQGRSNLKAAWVTPNCRSWEPGREAGGNCSSPWGHRHWRQPFLEAPSTAWTLKLAGTVVGSSFWLISPGT